VVYVLLIALIPLFALSAFFSSSETVLFSLTPLQLKMLSEKKPNVAKTLTKWQKDPSCVLSTILAGNTLVNFAIATSGYFIFDSFFSPAVAAASTVPVFTLLLLMLGEIVPKQYAIRHAESLAPFSVRMLKLWIFVLKPLAFIMAAGTTIFKDLLSRERRALTDDELRAVIEGAKDDGILDSEEASMVRGVMRLPDLYALNEMTPRIRLIGVEASEPDEKKFDIAQQSEYPYLPVYEKDMDHIIGFLDVEKFIADPSRRAATWIQEPLKVSEHDGLDDILVLFVKTGRRIALVEDRWGGTAGIITRGDIIELIVKPVEDNVPHLRKARQGSRTRIAQGGSL
jgi:CBS domain containing-hemolysin-like protein